MEPLSSTLRRRVDFSLTALYVLLAWIPLCYALVTLGLQSSTESLSPTFFYLLFRSTIFAFLQAALSVATIAVAAFVFGYADCFWRLGASTKRLFSMLGIFIFSISPTFVALGILNFFSIFFADIPSGLGLIILCHFVMNFGFVTYRFWRRAERFRAAHSDELLLALQSFGATTFDRAKFYLWPIFKNDLYSWAPQVFLWSFTSFAPIILLGKSPGQSTPEILLYYSVLNDAGGARILCIFAVTLVLGAVVNKWGHGIRRLDEIDGGGSLVPTRPARHRGLALGMSVAAIAIMIVPILYNFGQALSALAMTAGSREILLELLGPLAGSLAMASISYLLVVGFAAAAIVARQQSRIILFSGVLSAPLLLLGWIEMGWQPKTLGTGFLLVSLGNFLACVPWLYRQIKSQRANFPAEWALLSVSLGMSGLAYFRRILWPQHRENVLGLATIVSLWTLGEYVFSKALFARSETLPLYVDENLRRYNFPAASIGITVATFVSFLAIAWLLQKRPRYARV